MNNSNQSIDDCLDVKDTSHKFGYSIYSIFKLIKSKQFPNSFRKKGKWYIPISDIEAFIKDSKKTNNCLSIKQATIKLGYSNSSIGELIRSEKFPNVFKINNKTWIPISDVDNYIKSNKGHNYDLKDCLSLDEVAKELEYTSCHPIRILIKQDQFPNAFKFKHKWWIPVRDLKTYNKNNIKLGKIKNCLNIVEAKNRLGFKSNMSIMNLIQKNKLPNAFKFKEKWWIPVSDIEYFQKKTNSSYALDTEKTAKKLGYKSTVSITNLIRKGQFPNAYQVHRKWWIPISDIEIFKTRFNNNNCVNLKEAIQILSESSIKSIKSKIYNKTFPNAFKSGRKWYIPLTDIKEYLLLKSTYPQSKKRKEKIAPSPSFLSLQEASIRLGYKSTSTLRVYIKKDKFPNSIKISEQWWIPISDIETYEKSLKKNEQTCLNTKETSIRLKKSKTYITKMINNNVFPNALKKNNQWFIPLKNIEDFEERPKKSLLKKQYTGQLGFMELKEFILAMEEKQVLRETKKLFLDYCLLQTNKISGSSTHIKNTVSQFKRFYTDLNSILYKEIYFLEAEEINSLFNDDSTLSRDQKKIFSRFLKYTYSIKNIKPKEQFIISQKKQRKENKEIYPPDVFYKIYKYIKDIKTHTKNSIKDRTYANMWSYLILLMTDFIRGQDLILNTPNINLNNLNINTFDWFLENELSDFQAGAVIKQLYIHFRHKRTSKTDKLLTFVVSPDLIKPLATSLVISELHRKIDESPMLLDTFFQGQYNHIRTDGKRSHKNFFKKIPELKEFQFSSQKMNNSVATYLFYSITEEDEYDAELALHLTQTARSHKKPETTSIYIQTTNKDGSINRVSYNLFRRGHFGWLYNYLILYASQNKQLNASLEERTKLIEGIRQEISLRDLEGLSQFIDNYQSLIPLDDKSNNMQAYLTNIYNKRRSVISKLLNFSLEEIKGILKKLAKGHMPSKHQHAQCLIYPSCNYPRLVNCYSCEYIIPNNLLLIQLKEELNRLIVNLKSCTNETLILKDSKFLLHVLLIWKEARLAFGEEKVNVYISAEETWKRIKNIAHKLQN